MRLSLTPKEATAVVEALRWVVRNTQNSQHDDAGKGARVTEAQEIALSVTRKIRGAKA